MKLADLREPEYNPRQIGEDELSSLGFSLAEFGDISGIVWNKATGHVVAGNQRLKALRKQHGDDLKIVKGALVTPEGEQFPIRVVEWDSIKERAANIAANSPTMQGVFTAEVEAIVSEIEQERPDLTDRLGLATLSGEELDDIAAQLGEDTEDGPAEMELQPFEHYDYVIVLARNTLDWNILCDRLGLQRVNASPIPGKKKIGLGRAIEASRLLELLREDVADD